MSVVDEFAAAPCPFPGNDWGSFWNVRKVLIDGFESSYIDAP
jgi:hypothetical protein